MKAKLFLIPTYLDESNTSDFVAPLVKDVVLHTSFYLVENVRTARRFIGSLRLGVDINELRFEVMDKNASSTAVNKVLDEMIKLGDVAVMSEAGLPGLADPGNLAVSWAHKQRVQVVPLPGASSIQMALIASGFNGQQFTFHGYLPIDKMEQTKKIKQMETEALRTGYTQVFMETPFRTNQLLQNTVATCAPNALLSIAAGISGEREFIATQTIKQWSMALPDLHKIPTIFCLGTYPV
jgi:16S rRNA (cytidine1402-2'-O)-methyltransferase